MLMSSTMYVYTVNKLFCEEESLLLLKSYSLKCYLLRADNILGSAQKKSLNACRALQEDVTSHQVGMVAASPRWHISFLLFHLSLWEDMCIQLVTFLNLHSTYYMNS